MNTTARNWLIVLCVGGVFLAGLGIVILCAVAERNRSPEVVIRMVDLAELQPNSLKGKVVQVNGCHVFGVSRNPDGSYSAQLGILIFGDDMDKFKLWVSAPSKDCFPDIQRGDRVNVLGRIDSGKDSTWKRFDITIDAEVEGSNRRVFMTLHRIWH